MSGNYRYSTGKQISLPETLSAAFDQLNMTTEDRERYEKQEFIIDCVRNIQTKSSIPTWARCKSLLSKQPVSTMQVGFIPFIPSPVTDQSTVYTAMKNFLLKQLEQNSLPLFCDEGVFRIVLKVYLKKTRRAF